MATEESPSGGSTLVGDPVVPILDIPPSEDLQPSPETLAAVVAATGPIAPPDAPTGPPVVLPSPAEPAIEGGGTSTTVTVEEDRTEDGATTTTTTTTTTANSPLAGQDGDLEKAGEEAAAATTTVTEERVSVSVAPTVEGIPAEEGAPAAEPGDEGLVTETDVVTVTKTVTVTETSLVAEEDVPMDEASALGKRGIEDGPADGEALPKKAKELEPVQLGPKTFKSGVEMFNYFYDLLHGWLANVDVNRYEKMVLQDLIGKGHRDPGAKVGPGIKAFQVRFHPGWHSRCFYLVRTDGSVDDFSYRKCVDKIMPLPENMFTSSGDLRVNKLVGSEDDKWGRKGKGKGNSGGGGGGGRFGGGKHSRGRRGGGRGGRWSR